MKKLLKYGCYTFLVGVLFSCNSLQESVEDIKIKHPNCKIEVTNSDSFIIVSDTINNRKILVIRSGFDNSYYYTNSN